MIIDKIKNLIYKLKQQKWTHIVVAGFYICELCTLLLTFYETVFEQIDLKNSIVPDYVLGFNTYLILNQLIGFILLGFFEIILLIVFFISKFMLKKEFIIKTNFFINNCIYHIIWLFGICMTSIITFCVFIYLIIITHEGIIWLIDQ